MAKHKTFFAGLSLAMLLTAGGAQAFTPVTGEILRPEEPPKSAPTWMWLKADRGDSLSGGCMMYLTAAGLTDQYAWSDCGGIVFQNNDPSKFKKFTVTLPDGSTYVEHYGLVEGEEYLFPTHLDASGAPILEPAEPPTLAELQQGQEDLRDFVENNFVRKEALPELLDAALRESETLTEIRDQDRLAMEEFVAEQFAGLPPILTTEEVNGLISEALETTKKQVGENSDALADDGWVRTELKDLRSTINDRFPDDGTSWWETAGVSLAALGLSIAALILAILLWMRKASKAALKEVGQQADSAYKKAGAAHSKADSADKKAEKAHGLAGHALREARVAINLGLPDGWSLIGDLPAETDVGALENGQSITLRFLHETKGERNAVFTMAKGSIKGPDGNMVDGLQVAGISGLIKPITANVNNMIGKIRKAINGNKFVGVDVDGRTNGPTSAAA